MTFEEMLNRARRNGEELFCSLTLHLTELGRVDDLVKAATDTDFREQLYIEFGLKTKEG